MQDDRVALGIEDDRHPAHGRVDVLRLALDAFGLEPSDEHVEIVDLERDAAAGTSTIGSPTIHSKVTSIASRTTSSYAQLVDVVVQPGRYDHVFALGHSMGGAITLGYAQHHPETFDAIALSAPMLQIAAGLRGPAPRLREPRRS